MRAGRFMQLLTVSLGVFLATYDIASAAKPEAAHFAYVVDAVNQINYLKAISSSPKDHSSEIAAIACKMLMQLRDDEQFSTIVRKGWPGGMTAEQKKALLDLAVINDTIDKEKQAFEDTGVNQLTSIQALAAAIPLAKSIDTGKMDPDLFLKDISGLQQKACSLTGEIADTERWEKKKSAVVLGVSGVAFVLANGAAQYYSWGLATFAVTFSYAIGANMVGNALHDLSNL